MKYIKDKQRKIQDRLKAWGKWRQHYIKGLGFKSHSIENMIDEEFVNFKPINVTITARFSSSKSGGKKIESVNNVQFIEDNDAQEIERAMRCLMHDHRLEVGCMWLYYSEHWSLHKIAKKSGYSRYLITVLLKRGETLLEGAISTN